MSDLEDAMAKCLASGTDTYHDRRVEEISWEYHRSRHEKMTMKRVTRKELEMIKRYRLPGHTVGRVVLLRSELEHLLQALRRECLFYIANCAEIEYDKDSSCAISRLLWGRAISALESNVAIRESTGEAGENTEERGTDMTDYTNRVETEIRDRDQANGKINLTKKEIIRAISSNVSDLAGIHTDDDGNLDRFALGASLDKSLRAVAFQVEDMADIDDE